MHVCGCVCVWIPYHTMKNTTPYAYVVQTQQSKHLSFIIIVYMEYYTIEYYIKVDFHAIVNL